MDRRAAPGCVLLAGGGSGGHVFPALALAAELSRRGWEVSLAGLAQGLEARLAREASLPFHPLPARPLVGKGAGRQLLALATLGRSALAARRLVRRLGARAVVGTGGYASAPAVLGARLARRPALLVEPNARAGAANRWLSRLAAAAAVGFDTAVGDLACPASVTGVPVRSAFFDVPAELPPGPPRLLVLGGSQGALQLNQALPPALALLAADLPGLEVLHQAGAAHAAATAATYAGVGVAAEVTPFIDDVAAALAACHLVVSRAGAITVAEICAAGRPALFVPLALAGGHQRDNARAVAAAGGAGVLAAEELAAERLAATLGGLLGDRPRLAAMARAARGLARPGAVAAIADRVEELAAGGAPGGGAAR